MEKVVGMVHNEVDHETDAPTVSPTSASGTVEPSVNLGIVIPVVLITVFLLAVGMCLLWHTWYDRLRHRRAVFKLAPSAMVTTSSTASSFCRSSQSSLSWEDWSRDEWRASTRSTTPLRVAQGPIAMSNPAGRDFRPKLGKISESPEDRLAEYRRKLDMGLCNTDDSIFSILSQIHFDMPPVVSNMHLAYGHSALMGDVSHSYPSLVVPPKQPFYNLTWLSPDNPQRTAYSDPNIPEVGALKMFRNVLPPSDPSSTQSSFMDQSWTKSPYHPNYNTPTNGSSTESNVFLPPGAILNRTRSLPDSTSGPSQPVSVVDFPASLMQMQGDPGEAVHTNHLTVSGRSSHCGFSSQSSKSIYALMEMESLGSSAHTSGTPMINASAALNMPSDIMASWYIHKDTTCQNSENADGANTHSDSMGPSSNASMCAHLGSTDNSLCHTSTQLSGNASLHQAAMSNSTGGTPGSAWVSTNTSTCAQVDSCESSTCSGTNIARHIQDGGNPVYQRRPSHSTSIMGTAAFSDNGTVSLVPGTSNSLHLTDIHGLSAIPPVASCPSTTDTSSLLSSAGHSFLSTSVRSAPAVMGRFGEPSPEWSLVGPQTSESSSVDQSGTSTAPTPYSDCYSGTMNSESGHLVVDIPRFSSGTPDLNRFSSGTPDFNRFSSGTPDFNRFSSGTPDLNRLQVVPATPALTPGSASFNNAFEWDTFPFYTPPVQGVPHVSFPVAEPRPVEPRPTPGPLRRWKQPVLSDMRYWV